MVFFVHRSYLKFFQYFVIVTTHNSFATQVVEKLVKQRNLYEFLCKDFRIVRFRMEAEARRTAEENEAVWKQAYFAFSAYVFGTSRIKSCFSMCRSHELTLEVLSYYSNIDLLWQVYIP